MVNVGIVKISVDALRQFLKLPEEYTEFYVVGAYSKANSHIGLMISGPGMPEIHEYQESPIVELRTEDEELRVVLAADQSSDYEFDRLRNTLPDCARCILKARELEAIE